MTTTFFLFLPIIIIDQLSKFIILRGLKPGESVPIIKNIFHLSLICNKGGAFGIFSQLGFIFIWIAIICVIASLFIFAFQRKIFPQQKTIQYFLSLIIAGAVSNLIDRMRLGCVIDFLDFRIWPVFNIADIAISIGTTLLILKMLKHKSVSVPS